MTDVAANDASGSNANDQMQVDAPQKTPRFTIKKVKRMISIPIPILIGRVEFSLTNNSLLVSLTQYSISGMQLVCGLGIFK